MASFFDSLLAAIESGERFALGIISSIKGSSPQKEGAKALFFPDGRIVGTLGGGCLEVEVLERAKVAVERNQPTTFDLLLDRDFGWDDGMICGGRACGVILPDAAQAKAIWEELAQEQRSRTWGVRQDFSIAWVENPGSEEWLYRETASPPCVLWVAGSGHVAQAVVPLAVQLAFDVTVFDDRPALANHQCFPPETQLQVDEWERLVTIPLPVQPVFGLIVTRGHNHDALVLRHWIHQPFVFMGMIGSRRKKRVIFSQFVEDKLASEEELERVACPVGLEIGAISVTEIAVSIVAQLVQKRAEFLEARALAKSSA